jgi:hypothetical protein
MRSGEDDQIPIPDRGEAELRRCVYPDREAVPLELNWRGAPLLQRQEGIGHRVAVIAPRRIYRADREKAELHQVAHAGDVTVARPLEGTKFSCLIHKMLWIASCSARACCVSSWPFVADSVGAAGIGADNLGLSSRFLPNSPLVSAASNQTLTIKHKNLNASHSNLTGVALAA